MQKNVRDCYWVGTPQGYKESITYSSQQRKLVTSIPTSWSLQYGNPAPWPRDADNVVTVAALDELLAVYDIPPTGLVPKKEG